MRRPFLITTTMNPTEHMTDIGCGEISWIDWLRDHEFADLLGTQAGSEHPFDRIIWSPGEPDRLAAWKLYTELRTRITTQHLAYRAGDEEMR
jgi:hypothetical protein